MGCAGSNPLPSNDTMESLKMADTNEPNQTSSMVQKVVGNINNASIDDIVKKIQDVTGSMDNLMDETQEKLGSFFGKVEHKAEDVKETVENNVNDTTLVISEKPIIQEVIIFTVEETKVIPLDEVKLEMLKNRNDSVFEGVTNETKEEQIEIKTEEVQNKVIEKQNEEEKVEEIKKQNEEEKVEETEKRNEEKKVEKNEENINEKTE